MPHALLNNDMNHSGYAMQRECLAPLGDALVGFPETAVEGGSFLQLSLVGGYVLPDPTHVLLQLVAHASHRLDQLAEHPPPHDKRRRRVL